MAADVRKDTNVQKLYKDALASFTEKISNDRQIIAAFVGGSLSYDEVWEKSDIDIWLITDDAKKPMINSVHLIEHGICFSTTLMSRSEMKAECEKLVRSWFTQSFLSKSTLLFSRDPIIEQYYEQIHHIGERDLDIQLLLNASHAVAILEKAEKWLTIKKDVAYCLTYILGAVEVLAQIEVMMRQQIQTREVIHQALQMNPEFFTPLYTELIYGPKDESTMKNALELADSYLKERHSRLFRTVFDYLAMENDVRSLTEITRHLATNFQVSDGQLVHGLEWLAQKGFVQRASSSVRLTAKSRVEVEELAYFLG